MAIGKENITSLCARYLNMINPVLLFFRSCVLMLFDEVIIIIVNSAYTHETSLVSAIHYKLVNVIAPFIFPEKHVAIDEGLQVLFCSFINFSAVGIYFLRK